MAMPSGNAVVVSEKMSNVGGGGGGEIRQWFPDERDSFISWLRAEFAAANAIIDSLCHHLQVVGEPGEYDHVVRSIQNRRCNWNSVLHMQQYFPISEVMMALNQAAGWRHGPSRYYDSVKGGGKEYKRYGGGGWGSKHTHRSGESAKEVRNVNVENNSRDGNSSLVKGERRIEKCEDAKEDDSKLSDKGVAVLEEKKGETVNAYEDHDLKTAENCEETSPNKSEAGAKVTDDKVSSSSRETDMHSALSQDKNHISALPKTFVGTEFCDGKTVNIVDGLKLYEGLFDSTEVSKLVSLVNDLKASGKKGQLPGQTYVAAKRPMKGRGREFIQLGFPLGDAPSEDHNVMGNFRDRHVEPLPTQLQDVIGHIVNLHIVTVKPNSCVIDFYNEGDHSQPNMFPAWFGRPILVLCLTECEMTFGRVIVTDHPGDYRGALKLSVSPGSLLMMQGRSADNAKNAIPSIGRQRILVTFTKSQPKNARLPSHVGGQSSHWGAPSSRPANHIRHPMGPRPYAVPTTGVLPAPPIRPQITPNGIPPLFVTTPVAPSMPYAAPVPIPAGSTGWGAPPPRHPPPRLPIPGTGVFLPPGSGNSASQQASATAGEMNLFLDAPLQPEKENGFATSNHNTDASSQEKSNGISESQECNGSVDTNSSEQASKEEQLHNTGNIVAN